MYRFYGLNIETPLSLALNTPAWPSSTLGKLNARNSEVYLITIPLGSSGAKYGWRVVDATLSQEDDVVTYFRAFDLDGNMRPEATFGVSYASQPNHIGGGFAYMPLGGNRYYIPNQNNFVTPNAGGYAVTVLDLDWPSETMAFGMYKDGDQHQNLIISFRLFELKPGYPNDLDGAAR